jgi:ABC-type glycerol-3-phosphate transport system permease component
MTAMPRARRWRRPTAGWLSGTVVLAALVVVMLVPIGWMLGSSFKSEAEIYQDPPTLVPQQVTTANYASLFDQFDFAQLTLNSLIVTVGVVVLSVLFGAMAAYGFSRHPFRGDRWLLGGLLLTRMITPAAIVVPLYLLMETLGLLNTLTSIIVGIAVLNLPFVVWVLKPFFDALPREIEEAALIDGLTPVRVFWRIAVPLAAPGLMTVVLLSCIAGWTDLLFAMSFSTTAEATPLTAGILQMQTGYKIYWGPMMAAGVYLTLPAVAVSFLLQRYLIRGMRLGF